jgi:hypothetical protein
MGLLCNFPVGRLDDNIVFIGNAVPGGGFGMDFESGMGPQFAKFLQPAI